MVLHSVEKSQMDLYKFQIHPSQALGQKSMDDIEDISINDYRVLAVVRLAIASEFHKKGIRRDDIIEKVCSTIRKAPIFNRVLTKANEYLESNFGYQLIPLPVVAGSANIAAKTNKSRRAVVTQANRIAGSKSGPPQNFILVSKLSPQQRSLISRASRNPERLAVLHTVLMVIKLSGNSLEYQHLITAMNELRLCLEDSSVMPLKEFDNFLDQIRREKYIIKEKKNMMDSESVYSWGPRAYVEFPPANMAEFIFKMATTNSKEEVEPRFKEKIQRVLSADHNQNQDIE